MSGEREREREGNHRRVNSRSKTSARITKQIFFPFPLFLFFFLFFFSLFFYISDVCSCVFSYCVLLAVENSVDLFDGISHRTFIAVYLPAKYKHCTCITCAIHTDPHSSQTIQLIDLINSIKIFLLGASTRTTAANASGISNRSEMLQLELVLQQVQRTRDARVIVSVFSRKTRAIYDCIARVIKPEPRIGRSPRSHARTCNPRVSDTRHARQSTGYSYPAVSGRLSDGVAVDSNARTPLRSSSAGDLQGSRGLVRTRNHRRRFLLCRARGGAAPRAHS